MASELARQMLAWFDERGLVPVVVFDWVRHPVYEWRVHGAPPDVHLLPLCRRSRGAARLATGDELTLRPCPRCTYENARRIARGCHTTYKGLTH